MAYLPLKGYEAGHGIPGGTMKRSGQKMPKGKGSPLKGHLSEFDETEQEFDDGGFFEEQEFSDEQIAEFEAAEAFEQFSAQQSMMFSVLGAIADRLGMGFSEDGEVHFAEDFAEEPEANFDEHGNEYYFDENGQPYFFADDGEAYYFKDDDDEDDWQKKSPAEQAPSTKKEPEALKYNEFSDPALNGRITALEMREKNRNHSDGVNQLVDHYAAQLSEYHLDSDDIDRMREIAFSSSDPNTALHQFAEVVAKNVPTDPPHTFTDYMGHESYSAKVPEAVQEFAEYGPDMYAAAESLWQPFQDYKTSTNSQIEFKDYVKAQGQLGSTTNTGEGN